MIKLMIFDWNGTLIADTAACMAADNHVIKTFGGKPIDLKRYRETIVIPAIDFYVLHGCDRNTLTAESKRLGEVFHTFYEPRAGKVRTRTGARTVLAKLQNWGVASTILSNHTVAGIEDQLQRLGLRPYIHRVLANNALDSSMKQRNKRERLEHLLEEASSTPRDQIMIVGDAPEEVEIGREFGIVTTAITEGYYATSRLVKAKPDHLISSLKELLRIVAK